jgi:hypothetical protein
MQLTLRSRYPRQSILPRYRRVQARRHIVELLGRDGGRFVAGQRSVPTLKLVTGEDIDIKGPTGEITYLGNGDFTVNDDKYHFDKVCGRRHQIGFG